MKWEINTSVSQSHFHSQELNPLLVLPLQVIQILYRILQSHIETNLKRRRKILAEVERNVNRKRRNQ